MSAIHHHPIAGLQLVQRVVAAALVPILASVAFAAFILAWFALALILGRFL